MTNCGQRGEQKINKVIQKLPIPPFRRLRLANAEGHTWIFAVIFVRYLKCRDISLEFGEHSRRPGGRRKSAGLFLPHTPWSWRRAGRAKGIAPRDAGTSGEFRLFRSGKSKK